MKKCKLNDGSPHRVSSRNLREERVREDADDTMIMLARCKASKGIANVSKRYCASSDDEGAMKEETCSRLSPASVGELIRNNERNRDKENLTGKLCVNSKLRGIQDSRDGHGRMLEDQRRSCRESDGLLRRQENGAPTSLSADNKLNNTPRLKQKIPRPANAFMLFANEWRKKLAAENPRESNKDISVRLGILWKNMAKDAKEKYFTLAREVDAEHKRKYPVRYACVNISEHGKPASNRCSEQSAKTATARTDRKYKGIVGNTNLTTVTYSQEKMILIPINDSESISVLNYRPQPNGLNKHFVAVPGTGDKPTI